MILIELSTVGITVLLNQWNNRFYNALQERNWDNFVSELIYFQRSRGRLHHPRGLSTLPQSVASDSLAPLP